jgi:hypothetical protein
VSDNQPDRVDEAIEAAIKHIVMHHIIQAKGKNLGQYRTEYQCGCGIPHIVDDHNPNERGIMDRQAEHIAIEVHDVIKALVLKEQIAELKRNRRFVEKMAEYADDPEAMEEYDDRIARLTQELRAVEGGGK